LDLRYSYKDLYGVCKGLHVGLCMLGLVKCVIVVCKGLGFLSKNRKVMFRGTHLEQYFSRARASKSS
jgi:hypothetical protein